MAPPAPFEGAEKRAEAAFAGRASLRGLPRGAVRRALQEARCGALSLARAPGVDAYLLSESSLFVYPAALVVKTCGTTTLLRALPVLVEAAEALGLRLVSVRYSRAAYLFPRAQPRMHRDFAAEASFLDAMLGPRAAGAALRVCHAPHAWHVYAGGCAPERVQTIELVMYALDPEVMKAFVGNGEEEAHDPGVPDFLRDDAGGESAPCVRDEREGTACGARDETTVRSGIERLLHPATVTDAHDFFPCGYSMNGVVPPSENGGHPAHYTIHVTPEPHASFVSFETSLATDGVAALVASVVRLFKPARFGVSFAGGQHAPALRARPADPLQMGKLRSLLFSSHVAVPAEGVHAEAGPPPLFRVAPGCFAAVAAFVSRSDDCPRVTCPAAPPVVRGLSGCVPAAPPADTHVPVEGPKQHHKVVALDSGSDRDHEPLPPALSPSVRAVAEAYGATVFTAHPPRHGRAPAARLAPGPAPAQEEPGPSKPQPPPHDPAAPADTSPVTSSDDASSTMSADSSLSLGDVRQLLQSADHAAAPDMPASAARACLDAVVARDAVAHVLARYGPRDAPVFVVDLAAVERGVRAARRALGPQVALRYAARCNPDPAVLTVLRMNGAQFEASCAGDVDALERAGVPPESIAFVAPPMSAEDLVQMPKVGSVAVHCDAYNAPNASFLKACAERGIALELLVALGGGENALRVYELARGNGCTVTAVGLDLPPDAACSAVDFESIVASNVRDVRAFVESVAAKYSQSLQLSLGESYVGARSGVLRLLETSIGDILEGFAGVIVDVSRHVVGPSVALASNVIGLRRNEGSCDEPSYNYYLDDGLYGAFGGVLLERNGSNSLEPRVFRRHTGSDLRDDGDWNQWVCDTADGEQLSLITDCCAKQCIDCTLFGPTCDALDCIWQGQLPVLQVGDVVAFGGMGAYAASVVSQFNGFAMHFDTRYVLSKGLASF